MPPADDHRIQYIAVALICVGVLTVMVGDHHAAWEATKSAGQTVVGYGGALLTNKIVQQFATKGGVNNPPPPTASTGDQV